MNHFPQQYCLIITIIAVLYATATCQAGFACIGNPCINGICIDDLNSTYTCYCIDGFTGIYCQTNWNECWSSPCLNDGVCIDGVATYNCSCAEGFTGKNCEQDINECISNPCLNNGICIDVYNGYECQCYPGFSGLNCEIDLAVCNVTNEIKCYNNGVCLEGPGLVFSCQCQPGWSGKLCQEEINECLSLPCLNGGVCYDLEANFACACSFGYTGHNCQTKLNFCEKNLCENGALCLIENDLQVCYCVPDFHGDRCQFQYDECQLEGRCYNGGTCIDGIDSYSCLCPPTTSGFNCECLLQPSGLYNCTAISQWKLGNTTELIIIKSTMPSQVTLNYSMPNSTLMADLPQSGSDIKDTFSSTVSTQDIMRNTTIAIDIQESDQAIEESVSSSTSTLIIDTQEYTVDLQSSSLGKTSDYNNKGQISTESSKIWSLTTFAEISTSDISVESFNELSSTPPTFYTSKSSSNNTYNEAFTEWFGDSRTSDYIYEDWNITKFLDQTTSIPAVCQNINCKNGAYCQIFKYGPKCICRFGWEGPSCEYSITINIVAMTGHSYLIHNLNNNSSTLITMQLRTLSNNGIIFYVQLASNKYMYLYIQDGYLKFQFSCGIQTMQFSETKYKINNGYETTVLATVIYKKNIQVEGECNIALRINHTVAMSGEQTSSTELNYFNSPMLYIGGVPNYLIHQLDLPITDGLIGCMHSLQIDGVKRNLYTDASDGNEISECSSLACISNPCNQLATCIEQGHSWTCICPSGYTGKFCNTSICDNNPCQYGATCVQYQTNGFLCLCPLGKHGLYCEKDLEIIQPMFSSTIHGYSSFIAYRLPIYTISHAFELRLKFIPETMEQISLMLFIGQEDIHSLYTHYIYLSFIKGYIALTWDLGAGPRRIFTPRPILKRNKRMHPIKLGKIGNKAWLHVDGFKNITGRSLGKSRNLNTSTIHIGGHQSLNFENLPNDLPLHSGFIGCIFDVELHTSHTVLGLEKTHSITGRSVAQCSTSECSNYTCFHGGVCLQYGATHSCLCPDGWLGPLCAYRYNLCDSNRHKCTEGSTCVPLAMNYECDCPAGRAGKYCEKTEHQLSDILFSGHRSYLLYLQKQKFHNKQFIFELELKPLNDRSLILYAVEPQSDFFAAVLLQGGILEFRVLIFSNLQRIATGRNIFSVRSGTIITTGEWTKLQAGRFGQKLYLTVNGISKSKVIPYDSNIVLNNVSIYLGGTNDLAKIPTDVTFGLPQFYHGCIRRVFINYKHITLDQSTILSGRNIADCDGTPCGADVCANGGTCWLNTTLEPHCICPEEYQGERCDKEVSCDLVPCKNQGQCVLNNNQPVCHCPLGWIGSFCEKEMPSAAPFLNGNSYIIVDQKITPFKEHQPILENNVTRNDYIYIKFSTLDENGLLLWNTNDQKFFGIGIRNGSVMIVWSSHGVTRQFLNNMNITVNNGMWHSIFFKFNGSQVALLIDNEERYLDSVADGSILADNGLFYLGGFPDQLVSNVTHKMFTSNFIGCIEEFSWSERMIISNFNRYKAENIESCFENRDRF